MVSKILEKIDYWGYSPNFSFNSDNSFKSVYGGLITILFIISFLGMIIIYLLGLKCIKSHYPSKNIDSSILLSENFDLGFIFSGDDCLDLIKFNLQTLNKSNYFIQNSKLKAYNSKCTFSENQENYFNCVNLTDVQISNSLKLESSLNIIIPKNKSIKFFYSEKYVSSIDPININKSNISTIELFEKTFKISIILSKNILYYNDFKNLSFKRYDFTTVDRVEIIESKDDFSEIIIKLGNYSNNYFLQSENFMVILCNFSSILFLNIFIFTKISNTLNSLQFEMKYFQTNYTPTNYEKSSTILSLIKKGINIKNIIVKKDNEINLNPKFDSDNFITKFNRNRISVNNEIRFEDEKFCSFNRKNLDELVCKTPRMSHFDFPNISMVSMMNMHRKPSKVLDHKSYSISKRSKKSKNKNKKFTKSHFADESKFDTNPQKMTLNNVANFEPCINDNDQIINNNDAKVKDFFEQDNSLIKINNENKNLFQNSGLVIVHEKNQHDSVLKDNLFSLIENYNFYQFARDICKKKLMCKNASIITNIIKNHKTASLDFASLYKLSIQVQLLKYIILSNDQIKIFDFILKPDNFSQNNKESIYIERNLDSFSKFFYENFLNEPKEKNEIKRRENEIKELLIAIRNLSNEKENTIMNIKLLKNLEIMFK